MYKCLYSASQHSALINSRMRSGEFWFLTLVHLGCINKSIYSTITLEKKNVIFLILATDFAETFEKKNNDFDTFFKCGTWN